MIRQEPLAIAQISLSALEHNLKIIRQHAGESPVWAVLKANAYGHNVACVLPHVASGVQGVACARFCEALEIHSILTEIKSQHLPVLILDGLYLPDEIHYARDKGFHSICHSWEQLRLIKDSCQTGELPPLNVWLEVNSGMNRLGFLPGEILEAFHQLKAISHVNIVGVMAHLGTSDQPELSETRRQIERCTQIFQLLKRYKRNLQTSLSNSAHLFSRDKFKFYPFSGMLSDWIRPGICLYGGSPFTTLSAADLELRPVMTLKSRILTTYPISKGESVGYGATWVAPSDGALYVIGFGYGDGYPRHIKDAWVICNGVKMVKAGRVSMDLSAYFIPKSEQDMAGTRVMPKIGDYVEIWGNQIHVDEVANWSSSIGYERLTQVKARVQHQIAP